MSAAPIVVANGARLRVLGSTSRGRLAARYDSDDLHYDIGLLGSPGVRLSTPGCQAIIRSVREVDGDRLELIETCEDEEATYRVTRPALGGAPTSRERLPFFARSFVSGAAGRSILITDEYPGDVHLVSTDTLTPLGEVGRPPWDGTGDSMTFEFEPSIVPGGVLLSGDEVLLELGFEFLDGGWTRWVHGRVCPGL